MFKDMD